MYQDILKRQKSGLWPILQPRKEGPEGRHSQVKAGHLRAIQSKDKVVLPKDRPDLKVRTQHFSACFGKLICIQGSVRSKIEDLEKLKAIVTQGVQPVHFLNQLVKFST